MSTALDFSGKIVLVTGIGEDIAVTFSRLNALVVITDRDEQRLKEIAKKCTDISPGKLKPLAVAADLSKDEDIQLLVDKIVEVHGERLHILINNAGVYGMSHFLNDSLMSVFDQMISTNLRAVVNLTHKLAPMILTSKGNIINMSSVLSLMPGEGCIPYGVAKAGLDMFTKCLAVDMAPGVRVNCIRLGIIKTPAMEKWASLDIIARLEDWIQETYLVPRAGTLSDVTTTVMFLAHDSAGFITGQAIAVDGGYNCTAKTFSY